MTKEPFFLFAGNDIAVGTSRLVARRLRRFIKGRAYELKSYLNLTLNLLRGLLRLIASEVYDRRTAYSFVPALRRLSGAVASRVSD